MTAFIQSMDDFTRNIDYGENGHVQLKWSNEFEEAFVQLNFQSVRNAKNMNIKLREIIKMANNMKQLQYVYILTTAYMRDTIKGKGEYQLSYQYLLEWYKYNARMGKHALTLFVLPHEQQQQYGSWKDIKNFFFYVSQEYENTNCTESLKNLILSHCVELVNTQLKYDEKQLIYNDMGNVIISLCAKWIPREGRTKHRKLYNALVNDMFGKNDMNRYKKYRKYRKLLSHLNKYIDTVQIKQCGNNWSNIDFNKITSITMHKQKKAFMNIKKNDNIRYDKIDRIQCAKNFKTFIEDKVKNNQTIKGEKVGIELLVKESLMYNAHHVSESMKEFITIINLQWKDKMQSIGNFQNIIPMVDVSGSMEGTPLHVAIGLGICISEKSVFKNRIMTFSTNPSWVILDESKNFVEKVLQLSKLDWGGSTDFYKALQLILQVIIEKRMTHDIVENMTLVILSDMQINQADNNFHSMYKNIEKEYKNAGLTLWEKEFKVPHILFWNLCETNGFPNLAKQKNTSMMSGYSESLLESVCTHGIDYLNEFTPFSILLQSLQNKRFTPLLSYDN